jgi:hypothetical protein
MHETRAYMTRSMRTDLLNRLRVLAAWLTAENQGDRVTMEDVLNRVVEAGLPTVEHQAFVELETRTRRVQEAQP